MIKRLVVLQNDGLLQEEIAVRQSRPFPLRAAGPEAAPIAHSDHPNPAPPPSVPTLLGAGMGLKEIAKRAAMEAEKVVLKEVLDRVRWNRAEAARLLKISYKALLYKIAAAGLDAKPNRRAQGK
jgi:two-component system response regulator AtoC